MKLPWGRVLVRGVIMGRVLVSGLPWSRRGSVRGATMGKD